MASGSVCSGGSRRGLTSCLHSLNCRDEDEDAPLLHAEEDLGQAMYKLIVGFYDEAFDRLRVPCKTMPDLFGFFSTGGFCLGVLDPVSNIILTTLALLPKPKDDEPTAKRSKKTRYRPGFDPWHEVAIRSCHSLVDFLVIYFGCLNEAQAMRYLYRADANLLVAVMLIQHDMYLDESALDPESDRTQAALKWAATTAGHPSPSILAQVMGIRLKHADLDFVKKQLSANNTPLTAEDVRAIHRVLHMMIMTPMCVANISHTKNGLVVHVRQNLDGAIWSETKYPLGLYARGHNRHACRALRE